MEQHAQPSVASCVFSKAITQDPTVAAETNKTEAQQTGNAIRGLHKILSCF